MFQKIQELIDDKDALVFVLIDEVLSFFNIINVPLKVTCVIYFVALLNETTSKPVLRWIVCQKAAIHWWFWCSLMVLEEFSVQTGLPKSAVTT